MNANHLRVLLVSATAAGAAFLASLHGAGVVVSPWLDAAEAALAALAVGQHLPTPD